MKVEVLRATAEVDRPRQGVRLKMYLSESPTQLLTLANGLLSFDQAVVLARDLNAAIDQLRIPLSPSRAKGRR